MPPPRFTLNVPLYHQCALHSWNYWACELEKLPQHYPNYRFSFANRCALVFKNNVSPVNKRIMYTRFYEIFIQEVQGGYLEMLKRLKFSITLRAEPTKHFILILCQIMWTRKYFYLDVTGCAAGEKCLCHLNYYECYDPDVRDRAWD